MDRRYGSTVADPYAPSRWLVWGVALCSSGPGPTAIPLGQLLSDSQADRPARATDTRTRWPQGGEFRRGERVAVGGAQDIAAEVGVIVGQLDEPVDAGGVCP